MAPGPFPTVLDGGTRERRRILRIRRRAYQIDPAGLAGQIENTITRSATQDQGVIHRSSVSVHLLRTLCSQISLFVKMSLPTYKGPAEQS